MVRGGGSGETGKVEAVFYGCWYINSAFICVSVAYGGQKRVLDPLELELQAFVSNLIWVLETILGSSVRATIVLNNWAFSLVFN